MTDQQDITQEELQPCPFCGFESVMIRSKKATSGRLRYHFFVKCGSCSVIGPRGHDEEEAARLWSERKENKRLHAELLEIHTIAQCVGCDHDIKDTDQLTVKAVKGMVQQIKMLEQKMQVKDEQMGNLRIMEKQLWDTAWRYQAALKTVMLVAAKQPITDKQAADKMYEIAKQAIEWSYEGDNLPGALSADIATAANILNLAVQEITSLRVQIDTLDSAYIEQCDIVTEKDCHIDNLLKKIEELSKYPEEAVRAACEALMEEFGENPIKDDEWFLAKKAVMCAFKEKQGVGK